MNWCAITNSTVDMFKHAVWEVETAFPLMPSDCANTNRRRTMLVLRGGKTKGELIGGKVTMRDRSKNRKPLQKGRNLSTEAIQTVQALKRAAKKYDEPQLVDQVFDNKLRRLIKFDMLAVLGELLRQNECCLALKVFEDVRNEYWYKPKLSLYTEVISVLGRNGLVERVDQLFAKLKMEGGLEADIEDFNALLETLLSLHLTGLAMEILCLMKSFKCDPDKLTFKILTKGLESNGETTLLSFVHREAKNYYGEFLGFLEETEEIVP